MKSRLRLGSVILLCILLLGTAGIRAVGIGSFASWMQTADLDQNKIFDDLEYQLELERESYQVIVHLLTLADDQLIQRLQDQIGTFVVNYRYQYFSGFAAEMTKKQVLLLSQLPQILSIQWDGPMEIAMDTAMQELGISEARQYFLLDGDRDGDENHYSKEDVVIAMIDTGIDLQHQAFPSGKVLGWKDLLYQKEQPYDDHGHGTHIAGIVAGVGPTKLQGTGVAPGAGLVILKGVDSHGKTRMSTVDAGIEWVIQHQQEFGIDILNLSLGSQGNADGTDSTSTLVNLAVQKGINVVVAAGNQGSQQYSMGTPAVAEKAVTVTANSDQAEGGPFLAYFSSRGPSLDGRAKPDLVAPGWRINGPRVGTRDQYVSYSGTSMAAPFVAGSIALILDLHPGLSPDEIKSLLLHTAEDWGPESWDADYGWGSLQLPAVLDYLVGKSTDSYHPDHYQLAEEISATGFYDQWTIEVNDIEKPLAITMVTYADSVDANFDLYLYDDWGTLVAKGERDGRQEWISIPLQKAGNYTLEVFSYQEAGTYYVDIYGDILTISLLADNQR